MPEEVRLVTAGRVGRAHGLDGSFHVADPQHPLQAGGKLTVAGVAREVTRASGTPQRPVVRLSGIDDRQTAAGLRGELLLVPEHSAPLEMEEWLAEDLVGLRVEGLGAVARVMAGPSCDVLEIEDGTLIPLISDAVSAVDVQAGTVEINRAFLGLEP